MRKSYREAGQRPLRVVMAVVGATMLLAGTAMAGPKGIIHVKPLGSQAITIDGNISDWPLDKFTTVSQQPTFPAGQNADKTTAEGDHLVFDKTRVGLFNGTPDDAFGGFGASMYFAYDAKFLYILGVVIKSGNLRDDLDTSDTGSQGYLNDGFEFFLDPKGDSKGCMSTDGFPAIDSTPPFADDFQVTVGLNANYKPSGAAADVLGVRQALARQGNPDLVGPDGAGAKGGIYQDALTASGSPDIAAKKYADLAAAGAKNPEITADPSKKYAGYVVEMRIPFDPKIPGFSSDHSMGFDLFWRSVDDNNTISWADWGQSTTVAACGADSGNDLKTDLFNTDNWGQLVFDK